MSGTINADAAAKKAMETLAREHGHQGSDASGYLSNQVAKGPVVVNSNTGHGLEFSRTTDGQGIKIIASSPSGNAFITQGRMGGWTTTHPGAGKIVNETAGHFDGFNEIRRAGHTVKIPAAKLGALGAVGVGATVLMNGGGTAQAAEATAGALADATPGLGAAKAAYEGNTAEAVVRAVESIPVAGTAVGQAVRMVNDDITALTGKETGIDPSLAKTAYDVGKAAVSGDGPAAKSAAEDLVQSNGKSCVAPQFPSMPISGRRPSASFASREEGKGLTTDLAAPPSKTDSPAAPAAIAQQKAPSHIGSGGMTASATMRPLSPMV